MAIDLKSPPTPTPAIEAVTDRRFGRLILFLVVLLGVAFGFLLLFTVGEEESSSSRSTSDDIAGVDAGPTTDLTILSQQEVVDTLLRTDDTSDMTLEVLYTPDWYFDWSNRPLPDVTEDSFAFLVFETIHAGELTSDLPQLTIYGDGGPVPSPGAEVVTSSSHHRVTRVFVPAKDDAGNQLFDPNAGQMSLDVGAQTMLSRFTWSLPMPHGLGVIDAPEIGTDPDADTGSDDGGGGVFGTGTLSMGALMAIFAGMLTALSPCLLFLGVYYSAVLSGVTVSDEKATAQAKRKLFTTAAAFVGGFTVIYTIGGIGAGFIGASLSRLNVVDEWARPVSMVAGFVVVYMGLRTAAQANVPMVCKIPVVNRQPREGRFGALVMGSTFAVGCLSCFSATVLSALLLYAGATGSPVTGGLIMLIFSTGVGVLFLLAAWLLANAAPLMTWLEKARPAIGGFSAVIMIGFGILMITFKFHIWTGALFRLWS
jgi:cytochrome c-type biogenesis protein